MLSRSAACSIPLDSASAQWCRRPRGKSLRHHGKLAGHSRLPIVHGNRTCVLAGDAGGHTCFALYYPHDLNAIAGCDARCGVLQAEIEALRADSAASRQKLVSTVQRLELATQQVRLAPHMVLYATVASCAHSYDCWLMSCHPCTRSVWRQRSQPTAAVPLSSWSP